MRKEKTLLKNSEQVVIKFYHLKTTTMTKKEVLSKLRQLGNDHSVTLYIPTNLTGDYQANRIRWKNACTNALQTLESKGVEKTSFMKSALDLVDNMDFWAHQSKGLAGFYSSDHSSHHHLLNINESLTLVDKEFHLSPMLKEVINEDRIFVLAISQKEVRFFEAVKSGIYPVKIADVVPTNMDEALNLDIDGNSIQSHSSGEGTLYHGTDSGQDKEDIRLKQYFRKVDAGLMEFIHDEKVPLVIAAVEEYYTIYKECTNYNYFSNHMITGNPEDLSPADIRKQLDPVFEELQNKRIQKFVNQYHNNSQSHLVVDGLSHLVKYAENNNIDSLLVNQDHWDAMSKEDKKIMDQLMFSVYDNGGDIIVAHEANNEKCNTIHGIRKF